MLPLVFAILPIHFAFCSNSSTFHLFVVFFYQSLSSYVYHSLSSQLLRLSFIFTWAHLSHVFIMQSTIFFAKIFASVLEGDLWVFINSIWELIVSILKMVLPSFLNVLLPFSSQMLLHELFLGIWRLSNCTCLSLVVIRSIAVELSAVILSC